MRCDPKPVARGEPFLGVEIGVAECMLSDDLVAIHDREDAARLLRALELKFEPVANVVGRKLQPWVYASTKTSAIAGAKKFERPSLQNATRQNKTGTTPRGRAGLSDLDRYPLKSVDESGARRLRRCCCRRAVFFAVGAGEQRDLAQVIFCLLAVALFKLPQPIILPGLDVVGVGLQRALVPDLRKLVVAELAIGITDQIGDRRGVVVAERLQLLDRGGESWRS